MESDRIDLFSQHIPFHAYKRNAGICQLPVIGSGAADRDMEDFQIWNGGTSRPSGSTSSSGSSNSGNYITAERAKQIALAECPSGSTVVKCQFDWDDGRAQYEVEIRNGWTEYDFEIDAVTGTIFSRDIDNDRYD